MVTGNRRIPGTSPDLDGTLPTHTIHTGTLPTNRQVIRYPIDTRARLLCNRHAADTFARTRTTHRKERHDSIETPLLQRKQTSTAVDSSMSPTTIDALTLVLYPHLLNASVGRPTAARTIQTGTLPTLDNLQRGDEPLVQESLLGDALGDAVKALIDTGEPGIDIGKRYH